MYIYAKTTRKVGGPGEIKSVFVTYWLSGG
jgi:hypothetical protein